MDEEFQLCKLREVVSTNRQLEGGGFPVRRPFPIPGLSFIDPFLLIDEMGPIDYPPGKAIGAPNHPHRGFETVTYIISGEMQHRDSAGNTGLLSNGDVQWMTAGRGVIHSELPSDKFQSTGGLMHGFQIWVNLPAKNKMMEPRYQDVPSSKIPTIESEDGLIWAKVIAGNCLGVEAVIDTVIPITYLHLRIQPGGRLEQNFNSVDNVLVFVFSGNAFVTHRDGQQNVEDGKLAVFSKGEMLHFFNSPDTTDIADILVLAGQPINQEVARYGPFVMNTQQEILQAINDYQTGQLVGPKRQV